MTNKENEEKAREISLAYAETDPMDSCNCSRYGAEEKAAYYSALKMAEWKDKQYEEMMNNYRRRIEELEHSIKNVRL